MIESHTREALLQQRPRRGDYLRLRLDIAEDLQAPYLPPGVIAGILEGFSDERLTRERTLELLRGTVTESELPTIRPWTLEDLASAFDDHDG